MAEQRQTFRFRLPWLPAPAPRPALQTQTPTQPPATQASNQPTSATPAPRPPFRPPGVAPAQPPPPQAQATSRTESQPSSPSRSAPQSRVSTQPQSPSRTAPQSRAASQPSSPSRATFPSQASSPTAPPPRSPSRLASLSAGQTSSVPSSPSITATQLQPTARAVTQPPSPEKTLQPTTQESPQIPPSSVESTPPPSEKGEPKPAVSQPQSETLQPISEKEEPTPAVAQPQSTEPPPKKEITSDTVSNSQNQTPVETTTQPNGMTTEPSKISGPIVAMAPTPTVAPERPGPPQKSDYSTIIAHPKPLSETHEKPQEAKEGKEEMARIDEITYEEQKHRPVNVLHTTAPGSNAQTKGQPSVAFQAEQKQLEKEEILGTKEMLAPSVSNGKQTRSTISHPKDKSTVSESRQKPAISNGERVPLHKEIRDDISKFNHKMATGHPKQAMDEKPLSVITLTGENRGASMHSGSQSGKREGTVHIHRGYKINPDETAEATTDGEGSFKDAKIKENQETKAYINSNTQGINNSIVLNSSITERNPGVQLVLSQSPIECIKSNNRTESLETRKAEFNITPTEKLTYEPTVRRRCLRGLLMEPSDSDPDNPEKPRRHGCRYDCREKSKDNEINVS